MLRKDIESVRVLGVFGIVWYHSGAVGHDISYSGLVVFLILSVYLAGASVPSFNERLVKGAARLLIPWLFWFSIYALVNAGRGKPVISGATGWFSGILAGPSIHLWYLPYIFLALLLIDALRRLVVPLILGVTSGGMAIVGFLTVPFWRDASISLGYPWAQYIHAAPGVLVGLFYLNLRALPASSAKLLVIAILLSAVWRFDYPGVGVPYAVGICFGYFIVVHFFVDFAGKFNFLASLRKLTFGIYLVHMMMLRLIWGLGLAGGVVVPILAFVASLLFVSLAHKACPRVARRLL